MEEDHSVRRSPRLAKRARAVDQVGPTTGSLTSRALSVQRVHCSVIKGLSG